MAVLMFTIAADSTDSDRHVEIYLLNDISSLCRATWFTSGEGNCLEFTLEKIIFRLGTFSVQSSRSKYFFFKQVP